MLVMIFNVEDISKLFITIRKNLFCSNNTYKLIERFNKDFKFNITHKYINNIFNIDGGVIVVLGISDPWISAAYIGCILATLLCVVYGIINWNKGGDDEEEQISEEIAWHEKEKEMEEKELGLWDEEG